MQRTPNFPQLQEKTLGQLNELSSEEGKALELLMLEQPCIKDIRSRVQEKETAVKTLKAQGTSLNDEKTALEVGIGELEGQLGHTTQQVNILTATTAQKKKKYEPETLKAQLRQNAGLADKHSEDLLASYLDGAENDPKFFDVYLESRRSYHLQQQLLPRIDALSNS